MTDKRLEPDDIGYVRQEAFDRLNASGEPGGAPYEAKPAIEVHLGHPTSTGGRRSPSVLRIEDEISGQLLFELEFDANMLHDLMANRTARPVVRWYNRHPERIGYPETMWTITSASEEEATDQRERLIDLGWTVPEPGRRRGNVGYVWQVTARRWDGEPAGTVCKKCGWPIPNRFAAQCPECDPL